MKKYSVLSILLLSFYFLNSQTLKPYVLAYEGNENISALKSKVSSAMKDNGLRIVGQYMPANDKNRYVIIFTSDELIKAVQKEAGLTGFGATLRLGLTVENGKTLITYTNPEYWGNAYFQDAYPSVSSNYKILNGKLVSAMKTLGTFKNSSFGSEKGIEAEDLREYHYMMGMPYFDDTEELEDFDSYQEAINKIEASLKTGVPNVKLLYRLDIPGKNLTLYGFALSGEDGESKFMPIIDIGNPKHTAFLPYEVLVKNNEVHMLHGRFRIALSFPDLTMGTFTKIMSTPGDIEEMLEELVE